MSDAGQPTPAHPGGRWLPLKLLGCDWRLRLTAWPTCRRALTAPRRVGWLTHLKSDPELPIGLYRVPGYRRLVWLPEMGERAPDVDLSMAVCHLYHGADLRGMIRRGDTVMDCGGYVGLFTLYALAAGAGQVVVMEPCEPVLECLRRNCDPELRDGRVTIVPRGAWHTTGTLPMRLHESLAANTFADGASPRAAAREYAGPVTTTVELPVTTLDEVVRELGLARVDLVKMDVEGAEREAVLGARELLQRQQPRLLVCTYHRDDDVEVITQRILAANPDYRGRLIAADKVLLAR